MDSQLPASQDQFSLDSPSQGQVPVPPSSGGGSDNDVIEQVWVDKTQQILRNFANDPYQLNKELGVLRAEYIKHRFGKIVATGQGEQGA